ncbi:MAG: zinc-binding dehydrogenase [Polyangiaceae bacterium]
MSLQMRSLVRPEGEVEVSLVDIPEPVPGEDEVVVRIDAAPINPSDLGVVFARADLANARASAVDGRPVVTAKIPEAALGAMKARVGKAIPVGNEGAGHVVAAGSSAAAQALLGRTVAIFGGGTYAQHRVVSAALCLPLPEGTSAEEGASNFVNPMTALAMLETMRSEKHSAIVHTAAASNLGQMLVKLCAKDGVPLVNVVRRPEQAKILHDLGAAHVVDSSAPTFDADLTEAIATTRATLAFDAIGGGTLASRILRAMEAAASRDASHYSPYGSTIHKQLYFYGGLDRSVTELDRAYGMSWGVGGWLVSNALAKVGADMGKLRARVAGELKTTFASHYTRRLSLAQALDLSEIARYAKQATGEKCLIVPSA